MATEVELPRCGPSSSILLADAPVASPNVVQRDPLRQGCWVNTRSCRNPFVGVQQVISTCGRFGAKSTKYRVIRYGVCRCPLSSWSAGLPRAHDPTMGFLDDRLPEIDTRPNTSCINLRQYDTQQIGVREDITGVRGGMSDVLMPCPHRLSGKAQLVQNPQDAPNVGRSSQSSANSDRWSALNPGIAASASSSRAVR